MLRLVIPIDGSTAAHRAIDEAARLAKETTVEVVLVHVRKGGATYHGELPPGEYERIRAHEIAEQERILGEALGHARGLGLQQVSTEGAAGAPEVDVPVIAEHHRADMIVMTTRGLGAVGALLMGSTSQKVVHNATVPVLLVK